MFHFLQSLFLVMMLHSFLALVVITLNPQWLAATAGVILSVLLAYVPGLANWFNSLAADTKRLVMAGLLLLTSVAVYFLSCYGYLEGVTCDQKGIMDLITTFLAAIIANQSIFMLLPKVGANTSRSAKAAADVCKTSPKP